MLVEGSSTALLAGPFIPEVAPLMTRAMDSNHPRQLFYSHLRDQVWRGFSEWLAEDYDFGGHKIT